MVGKVDKPASIVFPVTPIDIGEDPLVRLDNLPQENLPIGSDSLPVEVSPTTDVEESILQVIIPSVPVDVIALTL